MPASSRRPGWDFFDQGNLPLHVAVAVTGEVLGSGGGQSRVAPAVYRGVTEHSVYVRPDALGRDVGGALLAALTGSADAAGFWAVQTGIPLREHRQPPPRSAGWLPDPRHPSATRQPPRP